MARLDPQIVAHPEWIGFVRPTGLVVSAPALAKAGATLNRRDAEGQQLLRGCVEERRRLQPRASGEFRAIHGKYGQAPRSAIFDRYRSLENKWG